MVYLYFSGSRSFLLLDPQATDSYVSVRPPTLTYRTRFVKRKYVLGAVQLLRNALGGEGGGHGVTLCDRGGGVGRALGNA